MLLNYQPDSNMRAAQISYLQSKYPEKALPKLPSNKSFKYLEAVEYKIFQLVNKERLKAGVTALRWDDAIRPIARYKSDNMLQYNDFNHPTKFLGGIGPMELACSYFQYYNVTGYGENIYMSQGYQEAAVTAEELMEGWMNSPGHRVNILNPQWTRMAVGVTYSSEEKLAYGTQHFAR